MKNEIFEKTKRFYEDLLDDNPWLQMTEVDGLWEAIESAVSDHLRLPGSDLMARVNLAICHLSFDGRSVKLVRRYI